MSSLTRWVLAHKRTVVIAWIVLTIAGIAAAGPATEALEPEFSVPDKEGWETNVGDRRALPAAPAATRRRCVPVVTLPEGQTRRLAGREARPGRSRPTPRARRCRNSRLASYASTGDEAFVSDDGRTTFAIDLSPARPDSAFGENPDAEKAASARARRRDGRGRAGAPDRLRRARRGQRRR